VRGSWSQVAAPISVFLSAPPTTGESASPTAEFRRSRSNCGNPGSRALPHDFGIVRHMVVAICIYTCARSRGIKARGRTSTQAERWRNPSGTGSPLRRSTVYTVGPGQGVLRHDARRILHASSAPAARRIDVRVGTLARGSGRTSKTSWRRDCGFRVASPRSSRRKGRSGPRAPESEVVWGRRVATLSLHFSDGYEHPFQRQAVVGKGIRKKP
jgi:hypothetical protein